MEIIKNKQKQNFKYNVMKMYKIEKEIADGNFNNYQFYLGNLGQHALDYLLEMAAFYGKFDIVKESVNRGANVNVAGCIAVQMACKNGHLNILKYLVESGTINTLPESKMLTEAVENDRLEIIRYLLEKDNIFGKPICDIHTEYDCALRIAATSGQLEMVKLLVGLGANVNIFDGYLLLTVYTNITIAEYLLNNGLKLNYLEEIIDKAKKLQRNDILFFLEKYQLI